MKWTRLLLIVLMAALTFGGSFTCSYNNSHNHTPPKAK